MKEIVDFFIIWLGNWVIVAMVFCLYMLVLRLGMRKSYNSLFHSIHFQTVFLPLSLVTIFTLALREVISIPFANIQSWLPQSFLWEQSIFYVYTTHLPSILLYSLMILIYWKRFDSLIPAIYLGFFVIGTIEFTFILQHLIAWQMFLGISWYSQFGVIVMPFIVERERFKISHWKNMLLFLSFGFVLQYIILLFIPHSLTMYVRELNAFRINYNLLPHPPLATWIFGFLQTAIKTMFIISFSFISLVKKDKNES